MPSKASVQSPSAANKRWLLRQIPIFSALTDPQIDFIANRSRLVEYEKEEVIYTQGDPPDAFYAIVSGRVRIVTKPSSAAEEILEVLHRGDYFGMISLLTHEPHSVTAQALNDCIILKIKRSHFEAILKEVSEVAIHLSTTLSKRLRQKDVPAKRVFESKLISIYSPLKATGRTMYAINLAASLAHETGKRVILLDVSATGQAICQAMGVEHCPLPIRLKGVGFDQSKVAHSIVKHPELRIDTLNIAHDPQVVSDVTQITPLLSYLANLYHFVIIDLPHEMDRTVFKALVQADVIHLVCDNSREHLTAVNHLLQEVKGTIQQAAERVRLIVNEITAGVSAEEREEILGARIYAILPVVAQPPAAGHPVTLVHPEQEYSKAVRRISREIGGVLVGLVLGSGAALGLAHIGVLKVLEKEKIPIDVIAGSSIGALIASFWAAGYSAEDLEKIAKIFVSPRSLFQLIDLTVPKSGIFTGRRVRKFLARYLGSKNFRELRMPLKVMACDYRQRRAVVLEEGPLVDAVRASISIPGIFEPIRLRGRYLADGGVLNPVPVDVLIRSGVHKVIAVNALPSPEDIRKRHEVLRVQHQQTLDEARSKGWIARISTRIKFALLNWWNPNIFDVIMHTMQGMEYELAEAGCAQADVALRPTIPMVNWFEFYKVDTLVARGMEETQANLSAIKKLVFE